MFYHCSYIQNFPLYIIEPEFGVSAVFSSSIQLGPDHDQLTDFMRHFVKEDSDSGGDTWALGGTIHMNSSDECSVAQLGSGRVVMNMRNYIDQRTHKVVTAPGHIVRAFADSADDGATFGPVRFAADLPDPICFSDLLRVNASTHGFGDIPSDNNIMTTAECRDARTLNGGSTRRVKKRYAT